MKFSSVSAALLFSLLIGFAVADTANVDRRQVQPAGKAPAGSPPGPTPEQQKAFEAKMDAFVDSLGAEKASQFEELTSTPPNPNASLQEKKQDRKQMRDFVNGLTPTQRKLWRDLAPEYDQMEKAETLLNGKMTAAKGAALKPETFPKDIVGQMAWSMYRDEKGMKFCPVPFHPTNDCPVDVPLPPTTV